MSKKKLTDLSELGGFVFSTNQDFEYQKEENQEILLPKQQYLEAVFFLC